jgi:hypothetical protein
MASNGAGDLLVQARSALLDALMALWEHRDSVVVIGAQAIYLHTGAVEVALAEATKDSDLAIDSRSLGSDPLIEAAMTRASFILNPNPGQPGSWINVQGIPVDLMVPEAIAGASSRRGARIPPHARTAMRRAVGLEAAVVDHAEMEIRSLSAADPRVLSAQVAGPAALLVAKLHKLGERQDNPTRLVDKDAHDIYRLLVAIPTSDLAASLHRLTKDDLAGPVTAQALTYLADLFALGATATGSHMAGRAEEGVGNPDVVAASCAVLASDLLAALHHRG